MVPSGWEKYKLNEITKIYDGTHQTPKYVESGVPFYSVEHLTGKQFTNTKYISEDVFEKESKRVVLEKNDILMTRIGDIGTAKLIDWNVRASFYVSLALIKLSTYFNSSFLENYINSDLFKLELWKRTIHVAFPKKINLGEIGECEVTLPPLPEQQKIAKILTTWDKAINTTERLIENSKQQKKALMQQLLTGQKRLLDDSGQRFSGDWEKKSIAEIANVITGSTPSTKNSDYYGGEHLFVSPSDLGSNKYISQTAKTLTDSGIDKTRLIPKGSSLFTCIGSTIGKLGIAGKDLATNQQINSVIPKGNYSNEYVYYQLLLNAKKIQNSAAVQAVPIINKTNFESQLLYFPPTLQEQQKIAAVLTNADREIEVLEQQLNDLQQEKKALIQQLLTGKKRVKVD